MEPKWQKVEDLDDKAKKFITLSGVVWTVNMSARTTALHLNKLKGDEFVFPGGEPCEATHWRPLDCPDLPEEE